MGTARELEREEDQEEKATTSLGSQEWRGRLSPEF
jgi:hypothetical protein